MTAVSPSFERIDYSIRTNKNIERKIVFQRLGLLSPDFHFNQCRYLGLGSMWFVDFILAHRLLEIGDLLSFESENPIRAEFNKPYNCVKISSDSSSSGLARMADDDWKKQTIAWFDYDGVFDSDVRSDCEALLRLPVGSVVIVTTNANRNWYRRPAGTVIEHLRELFGDCVPVDGRTSGAEVSNADFPGVLADSISALLTTTLRRSGRQTEGRADRFVPLFKLVHRDGVPMATVGGLIAADSQIRLVSNRLDQSIESVLSGAASISDSIDLKPMTYREKLALDQLLPCASSDLEALITAAKLPLDVDEARKYSRLYSYFPVFVESV